VSLQLRLLSTTEVLASSRLREATFCLSAANSRGSSRSVAATQLEDLERASPVRTEPPFGVPDQWPADIRRRRGEHHVHADDGLGDRLLGKGDMSGPHDGHDGNAVVSQDSVELEEPVAPEVSQVGEDREGADQVELPIGLSRRGG
jgi:hypothetical protein